jgi:hypothetical protein
MHCLCMRMRGKPVHLLHAPILCRNTWNNRITEKRDWYADYAIGLKEGMECCSGDSISWHYMTPELTRRIFHLMYSCKIS